MSRLASAVGNMPGAPGCCITRLNICRCSLRVDLAGQVIADRLRRILANTAGDAGAELVDLIKQLENAR